MLLRIDCPDCGAKYASHFSEFTKSLGYVYQIHCLVCGKAVFEHVGPQIYDGAVTPRESANAAALAAIRAYTTPTGRMKVVAREGESG
jgi:ribosomal protein S27E